MLLSSTVLDLRCDAGRCFHPSPGGAPRLPLRVTASDVGLGVRSSSGHLPRSVTVGAPFTSRLKTISQIYLLARRRVPSRVITSLNSGLFRNPLRAALGLLCGFLEPCLIPAADWWLYLIRLSHLGSCSCRISSWTGADMAENQGLSVCATFIKALFKEKTQC